MENTNIKCSNCKRITNISDFEKNGKLLKTCIKCRMSFIKSQNKNKCIHKKQNNHCKICGDEIKITISNMIRASKHSDKRYNRYDNTNFIDKCFLKNLFEDSENKCFYCKCQLQYIIRQPNLATIERLDNNIGHVKSNCVIACYQCNVSRGGRVGHKLN